MNNLDQVQQLVLSKFKPTKGIKLKPGIYSADFTVRVTGEISVSEDTEVQASVDWKQIALFVLDGMPTKDAIKIAKEALASEVDEKLEEKIKVKLAPILGKEPRKGAVRGTTFVKLFGPEEAS